MTRVTVGHSYIYQPVMIDVINPPYGANREGILLSAGDRVIVRNLPGAPKANIMGHCYIYKGAEFAGLVSVHSLQPVNRKD